MAHEVETGDRVDVVVYDVVRHTETPIAQGVSPMWTPDGHALVFGSSQDGGGIFTRAADGSGDVTRFALARLPSDALPHAWAPDGKTLLFYRSGGPTFGDIFSLEAGGDAPVPLLADPDVFEAHPSVSPDGRWLAYTSSASGEDEVWVVPFPNVHDEQRTKITQGGGREPVWSADGKYLYYRRATTSLETETYIQGTAIMRVPVELGSTVRFGTAEIVVEGNYLFPRAGRHYDLAPDGRLLLLKPAAEVGGASARQVIAWLNWAEELKRLVPTK